MFTKFLFEPIYNLLVFLTNYVPGGNIGLSIILVTVIIKVILYPLTKKFIHTQIKMKQVQPELMAVQKQYKDNRQKIGEETLRIYKEYGLNPFSGILLMIIQIPILFAIFKVFRDGIPFKQEHLYSFVNIPESVSTVFLGMDLLERGVLLAIIVGIAQFFYMKLLAPKSDEPAQGPELAQKMQKNMRIFMPVFTGVIALSFPAALALYWLVNTLFSIGQEYFVRREDLTIKKPEIVKEIPADLNRS